MSVSDKRTANEYAAMRAANIKTVIVHDTIDNTLTAAEMQAVMSIRNGKTSAHVCGAETKTGKSCKKRTKTQFCHLHTK